MLPNPYNDIKVEDYLQNKIYYLISEQYYLKRDMVSYVLHVKKEAAKLYFSTVSNSFVSPFQCNSGHVMNVFFFFYTIMDEVLVPVPSLYEIDEMTPVLYNYVLSFLRSDLNYNMNILLYEINNFRRDRYKPNLYIL